MASPFPHVLEPLADTGGDYTFAINGAWCRDTACTATVFSRAVGDMLRDCLAAEAALLAEQRRRLVVVGCVAWVTDGTMLADIAAAARGGVCLVVQDEPWLRTDTFAALPALSRAQLFGNVAPPPAGPHDNDAPIAAWCAGHINAENAVAWPRMHRKTLTLCYVDDNAPAITPYAAWIGSYNITATARRSVEDAVLLHSAELAAFTYREFLCVLAHARPVGTTRL
jgi:hypothetical protein